MFSKPSVSRGLSILKNGGHIEVAPNGAITLTGEKDGLSLSNTTSSVPDKKPNELWKPFVKGNDSRTGENGSGLGLAIAKRIFDMHKIRSKISYAGDNTVCVKLR